MIEALAIGTAWFWLVFVLAPVILIGWALWWDSGFGAGAAAIVTLIALVLLSPSVHLTSLWHWSTLFYVLAYVAVGVLWALWKWYVLCLDALKRLNEHRVEWQREYDSHSVKPAGSAYDTFATFVSTYQNIPPSVTRNKERVVSWMMFWPWSVVLTVIGDYIARFFRWIYRQISTILERIRDWVFRGSGLT